MSLNTLSLKKKKVFYSVLKEHVSEEKDLGVITAAYLKLDEHISTKIKKSKHHGSFDSEMFLISRQSAFQDPIFNVER